MPVNLTKLAASSYTAGFGDLGSRPVNQDVGAIVLGASAQQTVTISLPALKNQAIGLVRLKFAGISYNNFQDWWWVAPQNVVLTNGSPSGQITMSVRRANGNVNIIITYAAGSSGFTFPAHTVNALVHFYQLPF